MTSQPQQDGSVQVGELQAALAKLLLYQREAIILVGGQGLSYQEAAEVCDCKIGTMKSRVKRARARLAKLLAIEHADELGPDLPLRAALSRDNLHWAACDRVRVKLDEERAQRIRLDAIGRQAPVRSKGAGVLQHQQQSHANPDRSNRAIGELERCGLWSSRWDTERWASFIALLDASVLYSAPLGDLLMEPAVAELSRAK